MRHWRINPYSLQRGVLAIVAACAWGNAAPASAQVTEQSYGLPIHQLTPIEQRVSDIGALSTSLRQLQPGLAVPSGFEQVYRVPGRDDLLMRVDGGLVAVFPESVYVSAREGGTLAAIPPNTVFYIGLPQMENLSHFAVPGMPPGMAPLNRDGDSDGEPDPRIYDFRAASPPGARAGEQAFAVRTPMTPMAPTSRRVQSSEPISAPRIDEPAGPAIVVDEEYRGERVRGLLQRAAESRTAPRGG